MWTFFLLKNGCHDNGIIVAGIDTVVGFGAHIIAVYPQTGHGYHKVVNALALGFAPALIGHSAMGSLKMHR